MPCLSPAFHLWAYIHKKHNMIDDDFSILDKLVNGGVESLTKKEYAYLLSLLEDEGNVLVKEWMKSKWDNASADLEVNSADLEVVLQKLRSQIADDPKFILEKKNRKIFTRFIRVAQRVAAVLFIPIAIFTAYIFITGKAQLLPQEDKEVLVAQVIPPVASSQEYYSPAGTRSKVVLGDSTTIWLNSKSRLQVFEGYGQKFRHVKLVGEAYFDVKKNKALPFTVDLPGGKSIKVTGTIFTVGAYEDSKSIETVLIRGTVYVNSGDHVVKMEPSQKVSVNMADDNFRITSISDEKYKLWKDGILIFNETPMPEVITTLERWFNVKINVRNGEIMGYKFTAKLDNCSLSQVMDYMCYSSPVAYNVKEQNVTLKLR